MSLTREAILAAEAELPRELVEVPEWGGSVYVRALTGAEADADFADSVEAEKKTGRRDDLRNYNARMVAACVCDEAGNRLFTRADVDVLGRKSAAALGRVVTVAHRLNGIGPADLAGLEKNSGTAEAGGGSISGSPATSG